MHAELGSAQARIAEASSLNSALATSLQISRNDLVGRDQFEASNELLELESQLQTMFTITGRLANLTLSNFLR
jgi:flagellar hook-associated protein 3 FlgL